MPESFLRFLAELKRRRVFRVAAFYAVAAWALIQVSATVFPALEMPAWTVKLVILLVAFAFPVVIGLAWMFDVTPEGVRRTADAQAVPLSASVGRGSNRVVRRGMWFALGILVAGSGAWIAVQRRGNDAALDVNMVAVLPFRVSGDASLEYLRRGMLDLLAATLTGEGGPRSSEPRTLLAALKRAVPSADEDLAEDAAIDFARGLGAGQVLFGGIVGSPQQFTLTARVLSVPGGQERARASVEGSEAELTRLIEELTVSLLTQLAGEQDESRVSSLTGASLPALRAYLAGRGADRSGHYDEAVTHYRAALEQDSTFALAAFALSQVYAWDAFAADQRDVLDRVAFDARDRLSARDQKLLMARLGPNYPRTSTPAEHVRAAEEAIAAAPDRAEAWYLLGDRFYHDARWIEDPDALDDAGRAFSRAVELDSTYIAPMIHLAQLASRNADREQAARITAAALRADSTGEVADFMRWHNARATGDAKLRAAVRTRFPSMESYVLRWIANDVFLSPWDTLDVNDAELAADAQLKVADTPQSRQDASFYYSLVLGNLGRPQAAEKFRRTSESVDPVSAAADLLNFMLAFGWSPAVAESAARKLEPVIRGPLPADRESVSRWVYQARAYETWQLVHGRTETAPATLEKFRQVENEHFTMPATVSQIEALYASAAHRPNALETVRRFDRVLRDERTSWVPTIMAAQLLEEQGDVVGALNAASRTIFLLSSTREAARLAARLGERDRAIGAYQKYLMIRYRPEPAVQAEVDQVRAELAALMKE